MAQTDDKAKSHCCDFRVTTLFINLPRPAAIDGIGAAVGGVSSRVALISLLTKACFAMKRTLKWRPDVRLSGRTIVPSP